VRRNIKRQKKEEEKEKNECYCVVIGTLTKPKLTLITSQASDSVAGPASHSLIQLTPFFVSLAWPPSHQPPLCCRRGRTMVRWQEKGNGKRQRQKATVKGIEDRKKNARLGGI
jgi:hypothetical protein